MSEPRMPCGCGHSEADHHIGLGRCGGNTTAPSAPLGGGSVYRCRCSMTPRFPHDSAEECIALDVTSGRSSGAHAIPRSPDYFERFMGKVEISDDGCWLWTGVLDRDGYGRFNPRRGKQMFAHRLAYQLFVGEITEPTLDHLCRVRRCVNPAHLEPVSVRVNVLRGNTVAAAKAAQTHCVHGHEFTPANTRFDGRGCRRCRLCDVGRKRSGKRRTARRGEGLRGE